MTAPEREPLILVLIDDGAGLAALRALAAVDRSRFPLRVLLPIGHGPVVEFLRSHSIAVDALAMPTRWREVPPYLRKLCRYFSMYSFDAVHAIGTRSSLLSVALKLRYSVRLIWHAASGFAVGLAASLFCDHFAEPTATAQSLYERWL